MIFTKQHLPVCCVQVPMHNIFIFRKCSCFSHIGVNSSNFQCQSTLETTVFGSWNQCCCAPSYQIPRRWLLNTWQSMSGTTCDKFFRQWYSFRCRVVVCVVRKMICRGGENEQIFKFWLPCVKTVAALPLKKRLQFRPRSIFCIRSGTLLYYFSNYL